MTRYLAPLDVQALNEEIMDRMGSSSAIRDEGALESAVKRAEMAAYYEDADIFEQAAKLIVGIALAHAFIDGNKRTALAAGTTFLILNGQYIVSDPEEFGRQIVAIIQRADSLDAATERFVTWLRERAKPL